MHSLVELDLTRKWAEKFATALDGHIRLKRIRSWKNKIRNSEQQGCAFIFQRLRNKASDEPPNQNADGQIVTHPESAIAEINKSWDTVFAANVLADHPLKMLETVWPYISDKQATVSLSPITGDMLFQVVQKRKTQAAPGLDGWGTNELQALPKCCFDVLADFFKVIEDTDEPLPSALTFAKQVILNKPGPASPLNKRLITVLPPLLAYTGARYNQLQEWQSRAMPAAIVGGVKGRFMSSFSLYNDMRLDIDVANLDNECVVGVKLDKSTAFHRIIPQFAACLFVAFGIPQNVVRVFLKIYQGLHKHLAYRNWTSPVATTHANGVVQGCSFSILAMNAYNKVWYHLLEQLPGLVIRAYIDDSYLWCRLANIQALKTAIQVKVWDTLAVQKLNVAKSSMLSNSFEGRTKLKEAFADFPVALEFETLGTRIYTSKRLAFGFTDGSMKRIIADIDDIAALPVAMSTRVFLIGSKIIPQLTFGFHISRIPP